MSPFATLARYVSHDDTRAATCNAIALAVASNQPFYPLYLRWLVGGDAGLGWWTLLSTPFFLAVPWVARRFSWGGRALLPLAGIGNTLLALCLFGRESGVALFLLPCAIIALLAFRRRERQITAILLILCCVAWLTANHATAPLGRFDAVEYVRFWRLNIWSVAVLSGLVILSLGRAARHN